MMMDPAQHQLPLWRRPVKVRRGLPVPICCFLRTLFSYMVVPMLLLVGGAICFVVDQTSDDQVPHYSGTIVSVSGLDLLLAGRLDPQFNLTVRVASHKF
ncbi:hypothetical protein ACUV84_031101 [Puccinellia chinampoensis]